MKEYKIATKWEVKIEGKKRSIQLYDADGNKIPGKGSKYSGNFYCDSNQLTSLAGAPESVGGDFSCANNQLTSLAGAPESVGGYVSCANNQLTSLAGKPKELIPGLREKANSHVFKSFLKRGYLFADGILSKLVSKKKSGRVIVYRTKKIGSKDKIIYVVQKGEIFSHVETVKKAVHDLRYKLSDRDTTKYKGWTLETVKPTADVIGAYMCITGACSTGTRMWCEGKKLPEKLSVKVAIRLTKGAYRSEQFAQFFKGDK